MECPSIEACGSHSLCRLLSATTREKWFHVTIIGSII